MSERGESEVPGAEAWLILREAGGVVETWSFPDLGDARERFKELGHEVAEGERLLLIGPRGPLLCYGSRDEALALARYAGREETLATVYTSNQARFERSTAEFGRERSAFVRRRAGPGQGDGEEGTAG